MFLRLLRKIYSIYLWKLSQDFLNSVSECNFIITTVTDISIVACWKYSHILGKQLNQQIPFQFGSAEAHKYVFLLIMLWGQKAVYTVTL